MSQRTPIDWFIYSLLWLLCWVLSQVWFQFRFSGRKNVPPAGPVLLVANHQSFLDPVLVGIACPRQIRALARHELFFWPLGWLIRTLGAVPVDRQRSALGGIKASLELLKQGEVLLVFPEGTRTPHGQLQPLHPGFCLLARRTGATIVPAAIDGAFLAMPRGSSFPRPTQIRLSFADPIPTAQVAQLSDEELVQLVMRRMSDLLCKSG